MDEWATAATGQVCITCLDIDSEMFSVSEYHLEEAYKHLTGYPEFRKVVEQKLLTLMHRNCRWTVLRILQITLYMYWEATVFDISNMKHALCEVCLRKLTRFDKFREHSLRARALLMDLRPQNVMKGCDTVSEKTKTSQRTDGRAAAETGGDGPLRGLAGAECRVLLTRLSRAQERALRGGDGFYSPCADRSPVGERAHDPHQLAANDSEHLPTPATIEPVTTRAAVVCSNSGRRNITHNNNTVSSGTGDHAEKCVFICDGCQRRFKRKKYLIKHIALFLKDNSLVCGAKLVNCELCEYKCKLRRSLVRHMRTHTGEKPFVCDFCAYKFSDRSNLVVHMRKHMGEKSFACNLCDYKFNRYGCLVRHMRTHSGEKPFACKLCEYKSRDSGNLVRHMRKHTGEKPFFCKLCEYKCSQRHSLMIHMSTHSGKQPFACKLCKYKCSYKSGIVRHMKTHTGEKPFSCKLCMYKCGFRTILERHMKTHTGEKPFPCKLCEYKCSDKGTLARHMKTHTGEKPFACTLCGYKSRQSGTLAEHMRLHTGEKPYACSFCEYKSTRKNRLAGHMKKHSGSKRSACK